MTSTDTIVSAFAGMHPREPLCASQGGRWVSGHAQRTERATPRQHEKLRAEGQIIRRADVAASALACEVLAVGATCEKLARSALSLAQQTFRVVHARQPLRALRALQELLQAPTPCAIPQLTVGFITYDLLIASHSLLRCLAFLPATLGAASVGATVGKLAFRLTVALALAAAADCWLVRRTYLRRARMTRAELRHQHTKHTEQDGRPEVRPRRQPRAVALVVAATPLTARDVPSAVAEFSNRHIPCLAELAFREVDPNATVRTLGIVSA